MSQDAETQYFRPREYPSVKRVNNRVEFMPGQILYSRGGEQIRIYNVDSREIHGAIFHNERWEIDTWNLDGSYLKGGGKTHTRDIFIAPKLVIRPGMTYKSRDGRPIQVFVVNRGYKEFPILGAIKIESGFMQPRVWNSEGICKVPFGPKNDIVAEWSET